MKIIIIVPDGVGVRNYLFSNFVSNLIKENHEVFIYHKLSKSAIEEIKNVKPEIKNFIEIPHFIEKPKVRIVRESLAYARLLRNKEKLNNKTIMKFWNPNKKGIKKITLYFLAEFLGYFLSKSKKLIKIYDKIYEKEIQSSNQSNLINKKLLDIKPDFILNLHQRAPIASLIVESAKKININTGTVIFSWDNVPKARLVSRYNYYFVWSELMKNELLELYPEIIEKQIKVTGTPQFEFYYESNYLLDKKIFFSKYGLDIRKRTICYSGNDSSSPYEENYLKDICESISQIKKEDRPQIIFRRCPVDKSDRFDKVLENYKGLIYSIDPDWRIEKEQEDSFASIYPTLNDNKILINTVQYSDVVINLGSTMAHDFAVFDKPCLYLNYNPVKNSKYKVEDIYKFQHFRSMENIEAVGWINNKDEIIKKVIKAIETPDKVGRDRKKWLQRIILHPLHNNSIELSKTILEELKNIN